MLYVQLPPIRPLDDQLTLADIDTIKVVGKGSGGIVQLVQHKWTSQFFALKVYILQLATLWWMRISYLFIFFFNLSFLLIYISEQALSLHS